MKKWWKQLWCRHEYNHKNTLTLSDDHTTTVVLQCVKCGKVTDYDIWEF
jgi:hypothetical protein